MAAHLTAAEARALGLNLAGRASPDRPKPEARRRTTIAGRVRSRCHDCGAELVGEADASAHAATTRHARYDTIDEEP